MIALALVLSGCGGDAAQTDSLRTRYQDMDGCVMEARVSCDWAGTPWVTGRTLWRRRSCWNGS